MPSMLHYSHAKPKVMATPIGWALTPVPLRGYRYELQVVDSNDISAFALLRDARDRSSALQSNHDKGAIVEGCMWPRDSYTGPGGGLYTGPGGGLYTGPGGGASTGPGGGLSTGPGGGLSTGPGGGLSTGPRGGLSTGPRGGLSTGPGGGLSTGPRGGLSTGPGGGLSTGPSSPPYCSNWPPRAVLIGILESRGMTKIAKRLRRAWNL